MSEEGGLKKMGNLDGMGRFEALNAEGQICEIFLERETAGSMYVMPLELVEDMVQCGDFDQLRIYTINAMQELAIQIRKFIWKERLGTEELEIPATWWDHFKEEHFPDWLLERFPPKYVKFSYKFDLLYPDIVVDRSKSTTVLRHIS